MTQTAVQLRTVEEIEGSSCELIYGRPDHVTSGQRGPVAVFSPDRIVAYLIHGFGRRRLYIFRTLAGPEPMSAEIPGVQPAARLLLVVHTLARIGRVRRLFAYCEESGANPSAFGDLFYLRVSHLLGGRLPPHKVTFSLLRHEKAYHYETKKRLSK